MRILLSVIPVALTLGCTATIPHDGGVTTITFNPFVLGAIMVACHVLSRFSKGVNFGVPAIGLVLMCIGFAMLN
jgi:hypothetical protein